MKNIFFLSILILFFVQESLALSNVECFDYYRFNTGLEFKGLTTERLMYSPADEVFALYNLKSSMPSPIVEGKVFTYIFYNDPVKGEQIIDEFFVAKDVNLRYNDAIEQSFRWKIPENAKAGKYTIKTYFIVDEFFNLDGLSILPYGPPGVPGEATSFEVKGSGTVSRIYYGKEDTLVNGGKWDFGAPSKIFDGTAITIKSKLVNEGQKKDVEVSLYTYNWADVSGEPIPQYTSKKTISLAAGGSEPIDYELKNLPVGVYEVVLIASFGDEKSILKLRIPVMGEKGRLIYTGLDKFPLKKGEETVFFTCFSQSADYSTTFNGTINVEVFDSKGNKVFSEKSKSTSIHPTPPQALATRFKALENMDYLTIKASLSDENGSIHDSVSLVYDSSKFPGYKTNLDLKLSTAEIKAGEVLAYTISVSAASDLYGYVMDSGGKIIKQLPRQKVSGSLASSLIAPESPGAYRLVFGETRENNRVEASFNVLANAATTQAKATTTQPKVAPADKKPAGLDTTTILIAAVAAVLIIGFILSRRKKK